MNSVSSTPEKKNDYIWITTINKMQKKFPYRTMTLFMAFLMFSTSIGFSMDVHVCGGKIESFSFFGNVEACEMMQEKQEVENSHSCCEAPKKEIKSCHNKEEATDNCCHNETFAVSNSGEFETSDLSLVKFQQIITAVIVLFSTIEFFELSGKRPNYSYYNPPPIVKDISLFLQVFRI